MRAITSFFLAYFVLGIAIFSVILTATASSSPKSLNEVCNPSANECGKNAYCEVIFPCQKGRCACLSKNYRPIEPSPPNQNKTDCGQILEEGANCQGVSSSFLPMFSDCINSTVVCRQNSTGTSEDGICVSKKPTGNFGDSCVGNNSVTCDQSVGLECNRASGTCKCRKNLQPQADSTCRTSGYSESCEADGDCVHSALGTSPSASSSACDGKQNDTDRTCTCGSVNITAGAENLKTNIVLFALPNRLRRTRFENRAICLRIVQSAQTNLSLNSVCTVPTLEAFGDRKSSNPIPSAYCDWIMNFACVHCPEDSDDDAFKGRCRQVYDVTVQQSLDGGKKSSANSLINPDSSKIVVTSTIFIFTLFFI